MVCDGKGEGTRVWDEDEEEERERVARKGKREGWGILKLGVDSN